MAKIKNEMLKEGDANSRFFHRSIQKRRKINEILGLSFDGELVEDIVSLKSKIREHFEGHFIKVEGVRPTLGNLNLSALREVENDVLIEPYLSKKIKNATWDCDSYKSPGPDGVSFSFIKQF